MDVGATNGWRMDDVVPAAEIVRTDRPRASARARRGELPRRGGAALALPRRRRRDRRDRVGHAAVLRRLHAAPASPPTAGSTRACSRRTGHDLRALRPLRRERRGARAAIGRRSGRARTDRYSEIRSAQTGAGARRSRCRTSAAERRRRGPTPSPSPRSRSSVGAETIMTRASLVAVVADGAQRLRVEPNEGSLLERDDRTPSIVIVGAPRSRRRPPP